MKIVKLAYGCFTYLALLTIAVTILEIVPLDFSTYQVLGMTLGIPAVLLGLTAVVGGIGLTMVRWREWPLVVMSVAVLAFLAVFVLSEIIPGGQFTRYRTLIHAGMGFPMLAIVVLCGRWFLLNLCGNKVDPGAGQP